MSRDWSFYVEDIVACSEKIQRYTKGMDFDAFAANEQVIDAVIRNLEVIGEAAKNLPDAAQALMPEVAWVIGSQVPGRDSAPLFRSG